jgi:HlyD family secretion protein
MRKFFRISLLVLFVAAIFATFGFLYDKSRKKPVIYELKSPVVANIVKKTVATGSVVPRKEIAIKPQVSGIIEELYIEAGNKVRKGDLIAKVRIIPDMVNLNNAESRLKRAQINLEDSKTVYERQKKVFEQGVIPEAEIQQYRLAYSNAVEELESAENNLQLIREGVSRDRVGDKLHAASAASAASSSAPSGAGDGGAHTRLCAEPGRWAWNR